MFYLNIPDIRCYGRMHAMREVTQLLVPVLDDLPEASAEDRMKRGHQAMSACRRLQTTRKFQLH